MAETPSYMIRKASCDDARSIGEVHVASWLVQNPAVRFYESCGGVLVRRKMIAWGGKDLEELGYGWSNLNTIQ